VVVGDSTAFFSFVSRFCSAIKNECICPDRRIREPATRDYQPVSDEVYDKKRIWPSITAVTGHKIG
jgi:hypothetical protein